MSKAFNRLERLEAIQQKYELALTRVQARNFKYMTEEWGIEGLALILEQQCTEDFRNEISEFLKCLEEDTQKQTEEDEKLLSRYQKMHGLKQGEGLEWLKMRLVECGLWEGEGPGDEDDNQP